MAGPTEAELKAAAKKALAAGDAAAAKRLIDAARKAGAMAAPTATGADAPQYAPNGVPMNAAAKAEIAAKAKAGTLSTSPESLAGSEAMTGKAEAAVGPSILQEIMRGAGDTTLAAGTGLAQGAMETVGLPGTMADLGEAGAREVAGLLGMDATNLPEGFGRMMLPGYGRMLPSGAEIRAGASDLTGGFTEYDPQTTVGDYAQTIGQFIGGGMKPRMGLIAGAASEGAGKATEGTALEPYARFAAGLLGPAAAAGISNIASKAAAYSPWKAGIKSADELLDDARKLYEAGRASGATATGKETRKLLGDMWAVGKAEDIVTPRNRIAKTDSALAPFYTVLKDYAGKAMTPGAMRNVRDHITDAMKTAKGSELRLLNKLLTKFDDFMYAKVPQFKEADTLYTMGKGGQKADELVALAENRGGQFSQSGMENALRTEARGLDRKIIKGQERGYTADEKAMLEAMASRPAAVADQLSKFAPTSVMPIMANVGLGAAANAAVPGLGWVVGPAAAVAGGLTRAALTRGQKNTAELFNLLRRTESGLLPSYTTTSKAGAALRAIPGLLAQ